VAFAAIGVGRNPNGFVTSMIRPTWEPMRRTPKLLLGLLVAIAVLYGLRLADVYENWTWVLLTLAVVVPAPYVSAWLQRTPKAAVERGPSIEWLGLDRPYDAAAVAELDRGVGLPKVLHGAP
jgi:branched-chain amino acid transport system permease protein